MTIPELLLAHNYKTYPQQKNDVATKIFQKCVREGNTKKYYLNIWEYDWTNFPNWTGKPVTYSSEVQFDSHGDNTFDIRHFRKITSEEDLLWLEAFYEEVYQKMEVSPYESEL